MFAVLFGVSMVLLRISITGDPLTEPGLSGSARTQLQAALTLMPIAGIAFLWFVGVVRDRLGDLEDRFFSTVYLGSGLLFLAMMFVSMALAGAILTTLDGGTSESNPQGLHPAGTPRSSTPCARSSKPLRPRMPAGPTSRAASRQGQTASSRSRV